MPISVCLFSVECMRKMNPPAQRAPALILELSTRSCSSRETDMNIQRKDIGVAQSVIEDLPLELSNGSIIDSHRKINGRGNLIR